MEDGTMLFALRMMNGLNPTLCSVDDGDGGEGGDGKPPVVDPAAEGRLKALKAERAQRQALEAELAAIKAKQEEDRVKAAEEQGRFKQLYEESNAERTAASVELEAFKAKEAARVEALTVKAQAAVDALPENLRALVPAGLSADDMMAQVQKLQALSPSGPTGTMGGGGKVPSTQIEATPAEKQEAERLMQNHKMLDLESALNLIRSKKKKS
jgi:hypothetical protein